MAGELASTAHATEPDDGRSRVCLGKLYRVGIASAGLIALAIALPFLSVPRLGDFFLLLGLAAVTDALLPIQLSDQRIVSLSSCFTFVLFLQFGAVAAAVGHTISLLFRWIFPRVRGGQTDTSLFIGFNAGQLVLNALASGLLVGLVFGDGLANAPHDLTLELLVYASAFLAGNILLTSGAVWLSRGATHVRQVLWPRTSLWTAISFIFTVPLALTMLGISHAVPFAVAAILVFVVLAGVNSIVQLNLELGQRNYELGRANLGLQAINQSAQALVSQTDYPSLWPAIYEQVSRMVRADAFVVATVRGRDYEIQWVVEEGAARPGLAHERCEVIEYAIQRGHTIIAENAAEVQALAASSIFSSAVRPAAVLAIPLRAGSRMLGALTVASSAPNVYQARQISLLENLAYTVAVSLENATLVEQLRQALRDREEYLSVVSHELKNPIAAIRAYAQLAARRAGEEEDPRVRQAIDRIEQQTSRLSRLVDDLLALSRVDTGHLALELADTDLSAVVGAAVETARASHPGYSLTFNPPTAPVVAPIDAARIAQVLDNLIGNAVKYSPPASAINVRLAADRERVRISVRDRGIGIPSEDRQRIFQRFYRVAGAEEQATGLGIGLSVVLEIVRAHGGEIDVSSEPGQGSTFTIALPRQAR